MKKIIVTTTINPPTEAIRRFQGMKEWELVVIGDKKTPADYKLERGQYITPEVQENMTGNFQMPSAGTAFNVASSECYGRTTWARTLSL